MFGSGFHAVVVGGVLLFVPVFERVGLGLRVLVVLASQHRGIPPPGEFLALAS